MNLEVKEQLSLNKSYRNNVIYLYDIAHRTNDENAKLLLPVMMFVGFLLIVGVIGNALVCYVYYYKARSTKRTFIIVLAILDLVNCIFTMPFEIYDMRNQFQFWSMEICKVFRTLETVLVLAAGFTLLAVSIDRYIKICIKTSRIFFTPGRAKKICWLCLLISVLLSWPVVLFSGTEETVLGIYASYNSTGSECKYFRETSFGSLNAKLYIFILFTIFIAALIVMCTSYCLIGTKLYSRRRGSINNGLVYMKDAPDSQTIRETSCSETTGMSFGYAIGKKGIRFKGSTLIFFSVTFVFVIGFLPHLIVRLLRFTDIAFQDNANMDTDEVLYNFLIRSFMLNNAANPFIYSIFHKKFRKDVVKTCLQLAPSKCLKETS